MLSREELIKRGARFKGDGTKVEDAKPAPGRGAAMVGEDKIDPSLIVGAINQLSEVMRSVLEVQTRILEQLEKKADRP